MRFRTIIASIVLLAHFSGLILILWTFGGPQLVIWRNAIGVEAEMVNFTFDQELQGIIEVTYPLNGESITAQLDSYFSDYERGKTTGILVMEDSPQQVYWQKPLRFWFWELLILIIWGGLLVFLVAQIFPVFHPYRRVVTGITLIAIAVISGAFLRRNYQSIGAFKAVSTSVLAVVESVAEETCTRSAGEDREETYTCFRPTYRYGVGRQSYTLRAFRTSSERPDIGQVQELWYWNEDPSVARNLDKTLSYGLYLFLMALLGVLFFFGLRNLYLHQRPIQ